MKAFNCVLVHLGQGPRCDLISCGRSWGMMSLSADPESTTGSCRSPPSPPTLDALCISPSQSQLLRKPKNNLLYISMLLLIVPSILFQNCLNQKKLPISVLKGQQCTFLFWLKSQIGTLSHLFIISWYMVNHHWAVLWWILSQRLWIAGNIAFLLPICIHWAEYS